MSETEKKDIVLLKERIDFINVLGDTSHINHSSEIGFHKLKDYFCGNHGFNHDRGKRDLTFYSPKGSRTIIVEFTRNRQNASPIIKIKFTGSFLYGCQREREIEIRNFVETVWQDLSIESLPYTNEFDIAIDTLGATFESHGIDLTSDQWKLINKRRKNLKIHIQGFHNNPKDLTEKTGQTVLGSRFKFRWYDRIMALEQKYKGEEYLEYRSFYYALYLSFSRVMREEIKLKKELCDLFNLLFWGSKKSFDQALPPCLALFVKNHKFINTTTGITNQRLEENFYANGEVPLGQVQKELGIEGSPLSKLRYSAPKYNKKLLIKNLAKAHLSEKRSVIKSMNELLFYVQQDLEFILDEQILDLTKNYQTSLLLAKDDEDKRSKIVEEYHKEKQKLIQIKKNFKEECLIKRALSCAKPT